MSRRVVLVTHSPSGGVLTVTNFIAQVLRRAEYDFDIVLLATSFHDNASVRLLSPATWIHGPRVKDECVHGVSVRHVGAFLTEFEFQRYRPRRVLTDLLNQYDLVQVVAGTPAWVAVAGDVRPPVCLFAATTIAQDRMSRLRQTTSWREVWLRWMTRLNTSVERRALKWVDCVLAESDYTRRLLASYLPLERLWLGPPGVDTNFFTPNTTYCADGYIIAVGRLSDPRKNTRLLLDAYAQIRQALPHAPKLVLAGRNGLSESDRDFAAVLGLTEHIETYLNVTDEQLRALYQQAAIFVLSSDEEGLGIVILEAMACGLPVVCTDCGGPATAITPGKTGLLSPVGDAGALATAMLSLLEQPVLRRQMGQAGRRRVEERFSIETAGQVYLDVYERLLMC
ncbi:MAG: glycosyltransferase [Chloroflexi bacterium]|nr:glycosyltransferase [Chloroflexota bacterium]